MNFTKDNYSDTSTDLDDQLDDDDDKVDATNNNYLDQLNDDERNELIIDDWKNDNLQFIQFMHNVEQTKYATNETSTGLTTIQQTPRNKLRKEGLTALKHDIELMYGDQFDIVETKEGIVITTSTVNGWNFSWEIKTTIKSIDYDAFLENKLFLESIKAKEEKKKSSNAMKKDKEAKLQAKRAKKLEEIKSKLNQDQITNQA